MELSISLGGNTMGSRKIANFQSALPAQLRLGFQRAGSIFERDMKRKVSGPGRHKGAAAGPISRLGNFPGVRTGRLRSSINFQVTGAGTGLTLRVGPNVDYAPYLEFGTKYMQPYAFVGPTLQDMSDKAFDAIQDAIAGPLG
jgi:HK97 gp10 family phage protein